MKKLISIFLTALLCLIRAFCLQANKETEPFRLGFCLSKNFKL